jgi:hypothetical protein
VAQQNPAALGNAWVVDSIQWAANADAEMAALAAFNPKTTAIVDQRFQSDLQGLPADTSFGTVELTQYDPKKMVYQANIGSPEALVVFSEIFYEANRNDWQAYIDNEPVDHLRVNYLLRGLRVPAGQHEIRFEFAPKTYLMGEQLNLWFSIFLVLSIGAAMFLDYRKQARQKEAA